MARGERYRPVYDFDRQPKTIPVEEILRNIPTYLWNKLMSQLDHLTPREAAQHYSESGCTSCRNNLERLAESL